MKGKLTDLFLQEGGLNVIQTYVFWNGHEPEKGKYYFGGRFDLVRFIKEIQNEGLYCTLRIGPFIQGEWHHGGFPYWLREEPGVVFRTDNDPFKVLDEADMLLSMEFENVIDDILKALSQDRRTYLFLCYYD